MPFYELVRKHHELNYALGGVDEVVTKVERSQIMRFTNLTAVKGAATRLLSTDCYYEFQDVKWEDLSMYSRKICVCGWHENVPEEWQVMEVRLHNRFGLGVFERRIYDVLMRCSTEGYTAEEIAGLLDITTVAVYPNLNSLAKRKVLRCGRSYIEKNIPISIYALTPYAEVWNEFAWKLPNWYNNHAW